MLLCGFFNVWLIHFHFLLLIWVIIFSFWVFASRSSLLMVFSHLTPKMLRRRRFVKAWIFAEIFFVTLQVSAMYQDRFYIWIEDPKFGPQGYLFRSPHRSQQEECCSGFANPHQHSTSCFVPPSTAITLPT